MSKTPLSSSCLCRDTRLGVGIPVSLMLKGAPDPQHSQFQRPPHTSSPAQSQWGPRLLAQIINPSLKAFGWTLQCSTTQSLNPQGRFSSSSMKLPKFPLGKGITWISEAPPEAGFGRGGDRTRSLSHSRESVLPSGLHEDVRRGKAWNGMDHTQPGTLELPPEELLWDAKVLLGR